jgi:hypothetical protein
MLFLYRPRQTWMPYRVPRPRDQVEYNRHMQDAFAATHQVPPSSLTGAAARDPETMLQQLAELHDSGILTDAEYAAAKAKVPADADRK